MNALKILKIVSGVLSVVGAGVGLGQSVIGSKIQTAQTQRMVDEAVKKAMENHKH